MHSGICLIVLFTLVNVLTINAFLFKPSAPKDGCNPNPCKNKAECIKDAKDPLKPGSCRCLPGYFGKLCENKDGCLNKPCKAGTCVVNTLNQANFTCKCPVGRVGQRCEKTDACAKNPCKNNATCKLDAKLNAVCSCQLGWVSKNCDKRNCTIVEFKGKNFAKLPKIFIDQAVQLKFKEFDAAALKCKVTVKQSRSYSVQSKSLVIPSDAPFYIGRGLTFELADQKGGLLCNSVCLSKKPIPQIGAKCFIDEVIAKGWKWDADKLSIHDGLYLSNPVLYHQLRQTAQVGCKDKSF